jgi:hypothetical protein
MCTSNLSEISEEVLKNGLRGNVAMSNQFQSGYATELLGNIDSSCSDLRFAISVIKNQQGVRGCELSVEQAKIAVKNRIVQMREILSLLEGTVQ